ncbi:MAG: glutamate 5-kinase [Alphaproteobacteria bacterium]|nr:glutamate 5-kinase [Alphaproteobacteria bacterium]
MNAAANSGAFARTRRLVVKTGSALVVDEAGGIKADWLEGLADDIAMLAARGLEAIVVTSGAVAIGRWKLGYGKRSLKIEEKQAAAATGQVWLAHAWIEALAKRGIVGSQVLLTPDDTESRRRHLNARATVATLLEARAVPVINENDTTATEEIRFGDNDRLAARVAQMSSADTLVLLSDVDGLYTADPHRDPAARHLSEVTELTPEVLEMAGEARPGYSSGGMVTKLGAARIALAAGCRMAIASGKPVRPLSAIEAGARCTWFVPQGSPASARKRWIAGTVEPAGAVVIDDGAARALDKGKSLLPAGVVGVEGAFDRGDAIRVRDRGGREIARGLSAYAAADVKRIMGRKSSEIEAILGFRGRDEIIHRDDLTMTSAS